MKMNFGSKKKNLNDCDRLGGLDLNSNWIEFD